MNRCPKCGWDRILGPKYDPSDDMLIYQCPRCGYRELRFPLDAAAKGRK